MLNAALNASQKERITLITGDDITIGRDFKERWNISTDIRVQAHLLLKDGYEALVILEAKRTGRATWLEPTSTRAPSFQIRTRKLRLSLSSEEVAYIQDILHCHGLSFFIQISDDTTEPQALVKLVHDQGTVASSRRTHHLGYSLSE